jgi:hypothetical protein
LAGSAFKDKDVIEALTHFTPILVDGDTETEITKKLASRGFPTTVFADLKGDPVATVVGAVAVKDFLREAQGAAKKAKRGKGSKEYAALVKADEELTKALEKDNVRGALAAADKAVETKLDHALVRKAHAAREKLMKAGEEQLWLAKKQVDAGEGESARTALRKLNQDYKGTPVGDQAKELLKQLADGEDE